MGHLLEAKKVYKDLQTRLDENPAGAPASEDFYEILRLLFTEEEALVASRMPHAPASLGAVERKVKMPRAKLEGLLEKMAAKGLVVDFVNPRSGKTLYFAAPAVVGFFEFSMMRERTDIPQKRLAKLMASYMYGDDAFAREVFRESTQLARTVAHETSIPEGDFSEVMSWERATEIIEEAGRGAISLCYCRHKMRHCGEACGAPEDICMSIGPASEYTIRRGLGREASKSELLESLHRAREHNLVHITDNVQQNPSFICSCCCGMLQGLNRHGLEHTVHTSGFVADVELNNCSGCGKCARSCPIDAIDVYEANRRAENGKKVRWAEVNQDRCIGCGVCHRNCDFEALKMKRRTQRLLTPVSTLERVLTQAIERGKLHHFLFDRFESPTADFAKNLVGAALNMPVAKRILLNKEVKSRFLDFVSSQTSEPGGAG